MNATDIECSVIVARAGLRLPQDSIVPENAGLFTNEGPGFLAQKQLWDKLRALELWGEYRGLLTEKHDTTHRQTWEDIIAESRKDEKPDA